MVASEAPRKRSSGSRKTDEQGIDGADADGAVNAEGADFPGFLRFPDAHQPGEQTAAADAEQIGQRGDHHHQGQRQGGGGHHIGIACAADEEGVHHVIDQVNQLADDRGNGHGYQCFRDRRGRKEFLLADGVFRILGFTDHGNRSLPFDRIADNRLRPRLNAKRIMRPERVMRSRPLYPFSRNNSRRAFLFVLDRRTFLFVQDRQLPAFIQDSPQTVLNYRGKASGVCGIYRRRENRDKEQERGRKHANQAFDDAGS